MIDPMFLIDGYKLDHRRQYPAGTTRVYSNWTPRSSRVEGQEEVVFFGLQYLLGKYLSNNCEFFQTARRDVASYYRAFIAGYLGPASTSISIDHIMALHSLGYLPLEFRAMPEGSMVPLRVPALTVENTDDEFPWLVNYIETLLSNILWMPCTSATTAWRMRRLLDRAAARTGGDPDFVKWQGHDFSMRGMPGIEAAQLSGAAHLLSFVGTDTIPAIQFVDKHYGFSPVLGELSWEGPTLIGGSVAATEHSVMSCGGQNDELQTYQRLLDLYPSGIVSIVSDTWDLWHVLYNILPKLKDRILSREGKVVIRPDSGDPVEIVCGDPDHADPKRQAGVIEALWNLFGGTVTSTGHRLMSPKIGVIYGDAITYDRALRICDILATKGFASTNMVFGMGSYTYQYVTRDTYGHAMKATWARVNGEGRSLFKRPVTDDGTKTSACGRLAVLPRESIPCGEVAGRLGVIHMASPEQEKASILQPVWRDGQFLRRYSFEQVRRTLSSQKPWPNG